MHAKVYSAQVSGLQADIITVEVDIAKGLHAFSIVGLPDKAVGEAKDRINAAIKNSGFKSPQKGNKKVTVSLAPADLRKEGSGFDLAIALGSLLAMGEVTFDTKNKLFLGELALDGEIRPVKGILLLAAEAHRAGFTEIFVPKANAIEAALIKEIDVYSCDDLAQVANYLAPQNDNTEDELPKRKVKPLLKQPPTLVETKTKKDDRRIDFTDVKSQETAKRGLEIAAAGGHNIALYGPPGTGKTMLARALTGILPPLQFAEIIETTGIHSAAGILQTDLITESPFRSPHHTASYVSIVGGGAWPKPGEITLAHRGVLFLDEFPEFDKKVIEALRQPLEDRIVTVARARSTIQFPAQFILVAAMNPCPCGFKGVKNKDCICSPTSLDRYRRKISGPIVDRIDLWIEVPQVDHLKLADDGPSGETSAEVAKRVDQARNIQRQRFNQSSTTNAGLSVKELKNYCQLSDRCTKLLQDSAKRLDLSARAYHRVIKVARTIADLANASDITENHLIEALQYRPKSLN